MDYDVEELARLAGVRVDTIRFYQASGTAAAAAPRGAPGRLLRASPRPPAAHPEPPGPGPAPRRHPPVHGERRAAGALARALRAEQGSRSLTRCQLAAESGVPEALIRAVEEAGILEPVRVGPSVRYTDADVELARAALALLGEDLPLPDLLALAIHHADSVREVVDRAIELFDRRVRHDRAARSATRPPWWRPSAACCRR